MLNSLLRITKELSSNYSDDLTYLPTHNKPMPSVKRLKQIVEKLREIIFPGYFEGTRIYSDSLEFHMGVALEWVMVKLCDEIQWGMCYECIKKQGRECDSCRINAEIKTKKFIDRLPDIRRMLSADVRATFDGDPAAKSNSEIIYCYPTIRAVINHRIAHELLSLEVPLIPRIISEMAHSETGIDIHPGATIGEGFMIDHGTGVVIGETCIIGNNVKIYQGVTLGAKSFPCDEDGNPIKGIIRHPMVEDDVIIYADATILGRITIGKGSVIGGNVYLARSVNPGSQILQSAVRDVAYSNGGGI
jgi:serine O-acetyltransferase